MKACGIIVEYNPFHNGHLYHLEQARAITGCDVLIAVMSGNFVQRGEPAILDKWKRASTAVTQGCDLILELPYPWVTQSASHFAEGAVTLLKLAQVSSLVFGSESNNLEELKEIASMPINPDHLKESMAAGLAFPKAYGLWAKEMLPNDILGVAYLKQLQDSPITPYTIQRTVGYHETTLQGPVASAKAIRLAAEQECFSDEQTPMASALKAGPRVSLAQFYPYLRMMLTTMPVRVLQTYFLFSEGIEVHLAHCAEISPDWDSFIAAAVNRRYTRSRIQRTCLQLLCQIHWDEVRCLPPLDTLRPLAFNETGRQYLKQLRQQEVRIASRFAAVPEPYRRLEYRSTQLYASMMAEPDRIALLKKEIGGPIIL
ncbi:tRNA(Met) cytidine acetate ligase [Holdemania filiformis]|uniref:tRNA(Met) cytidine acetate ligase n=1 Tax=Holdemania filiformis TaxID=61171 RepID=A0A412G5U2_9FIRM|nr:nucleotidyltransferase family protein [Holdemania filiformis]MBS5003265.1 nucleotidyltransferase family protein [Holdemania filiformis]RGR76227.1 hypothetical protein DWY25_02415 [Holdemania filiformis]